MRRAGRYEVCAVPDRQRVAARHLPVAEPLRLLQAAEPLRLLQVAEPLRLSAALRSVLAAERPQLLVVPQGV